MKIGVLTGGGDCPGLNPAIRAVVHRATSGGHEVVGILDGWKGLATVGEPLTRPLDRAAVHIEALAELEPDRVIHRQRLERLRGMMGETTGSATIPSGANPAKE